MVGEVMDFGRQIFDGIAVKEILGDDATLAMFFPEHLLKNQKIPFDPKFKWKWHQRKQCTHAHHIWAQL